MHKYGVKYSEEPKWLQNADNAKKMVPKSLSKFMLRNLTAYVVIFSQFLWLISNDASYNWYVSDVSHYAFLWDHSHAVPTNVTSDDIRHRDNQTIRNRWSVFKSPVDQIIFSQYIDQEIVKKNFDTGARVLDAFCQWLYFLEFKSFLCFLIGKIQCWS